MKSINIHGIKLANQKDSTDPLSKLCELDEVIEISNSRSDSSVEITLNADDDQVIVFEYEDGTEWIGRVSDLDPIFIEKKSSNKIFLKDGITQEGTRGLFKIGLKLLKLFKGKKGKKVINPNKELGLFADRRIMKNEGLRKVTEEFNLIPIKKTDIDVSKKHLLLIHGFISSVESSFGSLKEREHSSFWKAIKLLYPKAILAFNHKTISESPLRNVVDLLKALPAKIEIDILAYSRGGLIADLLSLASSIGKGIDAPDASDILTDADELSLYHDFCVLAKKQKIVLNQVTRVGTPANGTQLLSKRLDIFLNAVLRAIGLAFGSKANVIYDTFKSFVLDVVKDKDDAQTFPGIAAMVPKSDFLKLMNGISIKPSDRLVTVEGDAEVGRGLLKSIGVIIMNIIQLEPNDLVVNTTSMRFGLKRADGARSLRLENKNITHFKYFSTSRSKAAIYKSLKWNGTDELLGFHHTSYDDLTDQLSGKLKMPILANVQSRSQPSESTFFTHVFDSGRSRRTVYKDKLKVEICHTDLEFAEYPVLVGHFAGDEILSAEAALNYHLDGRLTDRFLLGNYLNHQEDCEVILTPKKGHKGGIVVGLGSSIDFTDSVLRSSITTAVLHYVMEIRDLDIADDVNFNKNGISPILIGSSYAGLPMYDAIMSILFGIAEANIKIEELNDQNFDDKRKPLYPITDIQFIEFYEDLAKEGLYQLKEIKKFNINLKIDLKTRLQIGAGGRKRIRHHDTVDFWHNLTTEIKSKKKNRQLSSIRFMSSSGKAKIEDVTEYFSHDLIDKVLEKFPRKNVEELDITNTLYNILIPKKIKNEIRNHPNIQWKMDLESAQYPWEMLHDTINDKEPIFVKSGMVRQLLSRASFPYERIVRSQKALVIGDPIYTHLKPLPFAEQEAEELKDKLEINDWEVDYISKGNLFQILARLQRQYKLLHIAGHGVYDPQTKQAGIVVEDTVIDSHFFKSLPYIPEFAFINCCYSGDIDSTYEQKTKQKYKLAASLGIQLIEQGVEAVIITGWAVDDDAALAFADIFYEHLLSNKTFGQAALAARRQVYQDYGEYSVTWGAYQCYGNPHYKIQRRSSNNGFIDYEDEDHVLTLLFNLKSKCIRKSELSNIADQVAELFEKCRAKGLDTPLVLQNIAEIYFEIGELEQAKTIFEKMLKKENAKYSVRSLEQYCNLLFKIELENEKEPEEEYIKKILKYFDYFLEVQTNAERYSLRASAFKRLSMIYPEDMDKYLAMMVTGYMEALDYADQPKVYPLVNHRQAAYFTDANYRNPKRSEYKDTRKLIHEVKSNIPPPSHNDFWADIEIVNLLTTDLIYTDDLSTVDQLKDEIMKIYKKRFARTGTYKHLKSEIEHFDFLDKVINHYSDNHSFQLETIKADAVAYILSELKSLDPKKNDL